jgi:hypothetical protein
MIMAKNTTKIENDTAAANAALKEMKSVTLKSAPQIAARIADVPTEGGIQRSLSALAFAVGRDARKHNIDGYKFDDIFTAYATRFYVNDRKMPSDASLKGYRSRYNAFCEAGQMPYDATAIVRSVMAERDVNLAWRAGAVRTMLEAFKDKAPTAKAIAEALERGDDEGGGNVTTPAAKLKRFVSSGITLASDSEVIAHLADSQKLAATYRPIFELCAQVRAAEIADLKGKRKTGAQTDVANLNAVIAKLGGKVNRKAMH